MMDLNVALVGNPNCGKTTLFNALTGANQYVGNWPGVTVEKKTGRLKAHKDVAIVDLPGIYSLSPYTLEELIARDYLVEERPQAILNIVDGTNLERNLYLTTQVVELGIPMVMAINMTDLLEKTGDRIDLDALSESLGIPVVQISALKGAGIDELVGKLVELAQAGRPPVRTHRFEESVEQALEEIEGRLPEDFQDPAKRFVAVKLFERDSRIGDVLSEPVDVEDVVAKVEAEYDDDSDSIIVNGRYRFIEEVMEDCTRRSSERRESVSDKIDRIVTNRILALPIFAVVMFLVYFLSVTTVGGWMTDWVNDSLFGDGFFVSGGGEAWEEASEEYAEADAAIGAYVQAAEEAGIGIDTEDPAGLSAAMAQAQDAGVIGEHDAYDDETGENESVKVDSTDFAAALEVEEPDPADYGTWVPGIPVLIDNAMAAANVDGQVRSCVVDGIVAGVGAVLGFVPQMLVLFFLLAFLEGCGYMARIAFILDRVFRRFGLSGKSFVPMLIATGCGVPGAMASRTIENENDRHMTVMTTTFIPCGAKLPIIALIAGAVFGGAWWVAPSVYFMGIASVLLSGIILKKLKAFSGKPAPFVMELPAYHMPTIGSLLRSMWERGWSFIKRAGTIILVAAILIWFVSSYGFADGSFGPVEDQSDSLLAIAGGAIAWIFQPLGFGNWQATAATITGLIAKENVVSTFGILYAGPAGWYANVQAAYPAVAAYSFMAFNMLCAPCFAAIGAIRREMNNPKWFWAAIGYECGWAYAIALIVYRIGGVFSGEVSFGIWTVVAIIVLAALVYLAVRPQRAGQEGAQLAVESR
ncbi:MAG: ferrous iron transporter B [Eggerthellaceae bacterium]